MHGLLPAELWPAVPKEIDPVPAFISGFCLGGLSLSGFGVSATCQPPAEVLAGGAKRLARWP